MAAGQSHGRTTIVPDGVAVRLRRPLARDQVGEALPELISAEATPSLDAYEIGQSFGCVDADGRVIDANTLTWAEQRADVPVVRDHVGERSEASAAVVRERVHADADHALADVGQTSPNAVVGADGQARAAKIDLHDRRGRERIAFGEACGDPSHRGERERDVRVDIEPRKPRDGGVAEVERAGLRRRSGSRSRGRRRHTPARHRPSDRCTRCTRPRSRAPRVRAVGSNASRQRPRTSSSLCAAITTEIATNVLIACVRSGWSCRPCASSGKAARTAGPRA